MGKNEHKHKKHKHRRPSGDFDEAPPPLTAVPKLIVKLGVESTPERVHSPATTPQLFTSSEDPYNHHHHRHKDKKKKKKKDKKKSHDKDKERDREHRHHKKKKKRDYAEMEGGAESSSSYQQQSDHTHHPSSHPVSQEQQDTPIENPAKVPRLDVEGAAVDPAAGLESPLRDVHSRNSSSTTPKQKSVALTKVLEHLVRMLEKKDASNFFSQPVSDAFAPGYSKIIKEPMDFSTMNKKVEEGRYEDLIIFRKDFELICNNCMLYNTPDTIYYKAAKRLLQLGLRVLAPDRLKALAEHLPLINELSPQQLGFSLQNEVISEMSQEEEKEVLKVIEEHRRGFVRRPTGRFEAIPDNMKPEDVSNRAAAAAAAAAERLARRKGGSQMGYLRQKQDGTTSLAIVTPVNGAAAERAVTLGQLIGRIKNGASALQGFKEDRRNTAKTFNPIYYGAFSSYGPAYDSTFANLTKQETELVHGTYGDDVGVAYAESIKNFSKNCEYASFIVDNLLDIVTGSEHSKITKYVEEQKLLRAEEKAVKTMLDIKEGPGIDFDALKSLGNDGIDMSFLDTLQSQYAQYQTSPAGRLETNASLLENLRDAQHDRLSAPPPNHLGQVTGPSQDECEIADRVQANLVSMVAQSRPKDIFVHSGR